MLFVLAASLCTALLQSVLIEGKFIFFMTAVVFAAWYGGFGPGLACAVASIFIVDYFFINPGQFIAYPDNLVQLMLFMAVAGLVSWTQDSRRREAATAEAERRRVALILDTIADGVTVQTLDGTIVYSNEAGARIIGQTDSRSMVGKSMAELSQHFSIFTETGETLKPEDTPRYRVAQTGHEQQTRMHLRYHGGDDKWLHVKSAPLLNAEGTVEQVVNIYSDVTDRHRYQTYIEAQEKHLRRVLNNLFVFVGVVTPDGVLMEANDPALLAGGLTADDVIGKPFEQAHWWSYSPQIQAQLRDSIARATAGEAVRYDVPVRMANGHMMTIDFMLSPMRNAQGEIDYLIPSGVDLTRRIEIERERASLYAQLDQQRQRLDTIIANVPAILWEGHGMPNGGQAVDFVSPYTVTMLGYTPEDWKATPDFWRTLVHPDDFDRAIIESQAVYEGRRTGVVQFRCLAKDGRVVPVEAFTTILRTGNDPSSFRVYGVLMDVSQRRQAEESLAQYAEALKRSNDELQQFAYVASHDLQEPLRTIASYLQLIERRYAPQLDADGHEFIGYAVDAATRMKKLITDLLIYSRVDRVEIDPQPTPLHGVIEHTLHDLKQLIDETGTTVTHDPLPTLLADENQMNQLFNNLIGNAIKYRREGVPPVIHLGAHRDGHDWVFTVQDNGIGIEPQYLERIFVIFQRLHSARQYSGTGIGLAICKKIVQRHCGRIWAQSQPGTGTKIMFTLPAALLHTPLSKRGISAS